VSVKIKIKPGLRPETPEEMPAPAPAAETFVEDGPPPGSIDHRRWRIAAQRPNTPVSNPWIKTNCTNCRLPMWTRDPLSTWEQGGICEECEYVLRSEFHNLNRRQFQTQRRIQFVDPFRPR
jgi:hypothetical protein